MYDPKTGEKAITWGKLKEIMKDQPDDAILEPNGVTRNLNIFLRSLDVASMVWIGWVDVMGEYIDFLGAPELCEKPPRW